jgi:FkbM family methyltransferase
MFKSYAQNFEDVILYRALRSVTRGFYIDIGASHPDIDSVSRAFHEKGWSGIHVEPLPAHAAALRLARPGDIVIEAAVSQDIGTSPFFEVGLGAGISTCSVELSERHRAAGFSVSTCIVKHVSLYDILSTHVTSEVHWMKIDVEGFEAAVIRSWQDSPVRPWIVVVESTEPMSTVPNYAAWEPELIRRGYRYVYFDGLNRFYLSDKHAELAAHFSCGPNYFDGFTVQPHHWICPQPSSLQIDSQALPPASVAVWRAHLGKLRRVSQSLLRTLRHLVQRRKA